MPRENAMSKAARLLVSGRVTVVSVGEHHARAIVRGDSMTYDVTFDGTAWVCPCMSVGPCSHGYAAARVVTVRPIADEPEVILR